MLQQIFNVAGYTFNPLALPVLIVAFIFFFFSLKVLIQEELRVSLGFFLLGISIAIWLTSYFFLYCTSDPTVALWWVKAAYLGVPFIPAALYHFTVSILQAHHQYRKSVLAAWVLSAIFAGIVVSTNLIIGDVKQFWWGYYGQYRPLSLLYLLYAVGFQVLSLLRLVQAYQGSAPGSTSRRRNRSLLVAFCIASIGFVDYLPKFGISVYPFGYIPILVCIILVHNVIRQYRLIDITPRFASQAILDTMHDSLLVLDVEGTIRLVNRATANLLGYTERNLLGQHISMLFGDSLFLDHIIALSTDGKVENLEISYGHPDGFTSVLDLSASLMKDEEQRPLAHVFIVRDITLQKQTEAELIRARDELELRVEERSADLKRAIEQLVQEKTFSDTIIDSLPGIFYICDENGRLVRWNNNEKEMIGYTRQEILLMNVLQLFHSDRRLVADTMKEVFEKGHAAVEASLVTKKGSLVPFFLTGFRMEVKDKRYLVGVGINISERNRLEQQLHQSQKMEAVGILAGGVAHDFNNILTAIVGCATLLNMKMDPLDPLCQHVDQILLSAERAAALTRSLLAFSRKQPINLQTLDVNVIISNFNEILARLIGEDIEFCLHLSPKKLMVKADRGQLEQVLMNLAANSRDAMPKGGKLSITTDAVILQDDNGEIKSGHYAIISVSDTGMGMDQEKQQHIFEPFYTTKEVGKGTGLGLAIVYGIIKKHEGGIMVDSEPTKGTTFTIYLPLTQSLDTDEKADDHAFPLQGTETVLVIEDEASVRQMTRAVLTAYGYNVIEAVDGEDAVNVFRENCDKIHLVLCDVIMPKKNGIETHDDLIKIRPDIKTIFASGYTADILVQKGVQLDKFHFIAKPFNPVKLLEKVRAVLNSPREIGRENQI
jgi:two-component system cell cycle sensor histidine kinase/response regulator CckA